MADLALRFNRDMLVLSTSMTQFFANHDFDINSERNYVVLCEPELIDEEYKLESVIGTPCFVAPTEAITAAHLAKDRFEGRGIDVAAAAFAEAAAFKPQHILAAIEPTGLPLDESSQASLKQSREQYQKAVNAIAMNPYDGIYFCNFTNGYDAQCALMGARAVYDGPVLISLQLNELGELASGSHSLIDAVALCDEYGADAIGIATPTNLEMMLECVSQMKAATQKPLLVEIEVAKEEKKALNPPLDNPYYRPETLVDVAFALRSAGVQFLRAGGLALPTYTAVLNATVDGMDVVND